MNLEDYSIQKLHLLDKYIYAVNSLMIDKQDNLWIGGNNLCYYSIKQNYVRSLDKYLAKITASSKNTITSLIQDNSNRIIATTLGAGILIYHPTQDRLEQINCKNSNLDSDYLMPFILCPIINFWSPVQTAYPISISKQKEAIIINHKTNSSCRR